MKYLNNIVRHNYDMRIILKSEIELNCYAIYLLMILM